MISANSVAYYNPTLLQAQHWTAAAHRLSNLETLAPAQAWGSMEQYLQVGLREKLQQAVDRLLRQGTMLVASLRQEEKHQDTRRRLEQLRSQYLRVETMLDFFGDALASRANPEMATLLRACDRMADSAMRTLLQPLGHPTPPVLTYLDFGLGAAILKAGLRLWDGQTENPVAAIKVTRHNLMRPTALIHEAGHQVAHITGWNQELKTALRTGLAPYGDEIAKAWAGWSSEIAADAFGFVHTGYASVAALHDVVDTPNAIFAYSPGDPHPISYLRVLWGIACCQRYFGAGIWDDMRAGWLERYPLHLAPEELQNLLDAPERLMSDAVRIVLEQPYRAFNNRSLVSWVDPRQLHPQLLAKEADSQGKGFYGSSVLVSQAPLRRLAWNGYQVAANPDMAGELLKQQGHWMRLLG